MQQIVSSSNQFVYVKFQSTVVFYFFNLNAHNHMWLGWSLTKPNRPHCTLLALHTYEARASMEELFIPFCIRIITYLILPLPQFLFFLMCWWVIHGFLNRNQNTKDNKYKIEKYFFGPVYIRFMRIENICTVLYLNYPNFGI